MFKKSLMLAALVLSLNTAEARIFNHSTSPLVYGQDTIGGNHLYSVDSFAVTCPTGTQGVRAWVYRTSTTPAASIRIQLSSPANVKSPIVISQTGTMVSKSLWSGNGITVLGSSVGTYYVDVIYPVTQLAGAEYDSAISCVSSGDYESEVLPTSVTQTLDQ